MLPAVPRRLPLATSALLLAALAVPMSGTPASYAITATAAAVPSVAPASAAAATTVASSVASRPWVKRVIPNWSFGQGTAHWLATGESDRLVSSDRGHLDGRAIALRTSVTSTAALNDEQNVVASTGTGRIYRAAAWVRTPTPGASVQLRIREVRDGRELKSTHRTLDLNDRSWKRVRIYHTAAASGSTLDLNVVSWNLGPTQAVVIDDVRLRVRAPEVTPVDPGTPVTDECLMGRGSNTDCGVLWGAYTTQVSAAEGWAVPFTRLETDIGRRFDLVKRYHDFSGEGGSGQFPDQYERALGASGERTLAFAWTSNVWSTGSITKWRPIANGAYDASVIEPAARRIKAWGKTVFIDFDHEMDGQTRLANGTPADYIAAYRHIHRVFERMGVTNVVWAWVPTGFMGNRDRIKAMYPGDAYVDWLGYDPYNFHRCHDTSWESPEQSLRPFYDWMSANINNTKPVMLGEYGSVSDASDPERVRTWYENMSGTLARMRRIKAVMQWNSRTSATCDFRVTRDPQALLGFRRAGNDPYVTR